MSEKLIMDSLAILSVLAILFFEIRDIVKRR